MKTNIKEKLYKSLEDILDDFVLYKKESKNENIKIKDLINNDDLQDEFSNWCDYPLGLSEEEIGELFISKDSAKKGHGAIVNDAKDLDQCIDEILNYSKSQNQGRV